MARSPDRITVAEDIQPAIDEAARTGSGTVALTGEETYRLAETIHVKPGVVLDCQDAVLTPEGEEELFHIHPSGYVRRPRVHLDRVDWDGTVFTFDTQYGPYHPRVYDGDRQYTGAGVIGGYTKGVDTTDEPNGARVFFVNNRGDHDRVDCVTWLQIARHRTFFVDLVFDLLVDDPPYNRWTNGNFFGGLHWAHNVCIRTRGTGKINGNVFRFGQTQPRNYSDCFWDLQQGNFNTVEGMLWDTQRYDTFLRVDTGGEHPPERNLIRSGALADAGADVGDNYVITNDSFAELSVADGGAEG